MREVLARARERLGGSGRRTILFLDEIHRFNKAQQDALLPGVEDGPADADRGDDREPVLRGQLGAALARRRSTSSRRTRSRRCAAVVRRGAAELEVDVSPEVEELIAQRAGGDARNALNILELTVETARAERGEPVERGHVEDAARKRPLAYDKGGDRHYDFISAWIKSTRAGDVQASVYYLAAMLEGGEDARFIARRMIVLASEDIGNADPQALLVAVAAAHAVEHVGLPGGAPQPRAGSGVPGARTEVERVVRRARTGDEDVRERGHLLPPAALRSAAYPGAAQARPRRRLRLSARRPGGLRGRLPPGRAAGDGLLRAVRPTAPSSRATRGSVRRARSRRARPRACPSRSRGRGSG